MNLKDQVAPLALAQRMKALGFPQNTLFEWRELGDDGHGGRYSAVSAENETHPGDRTICAAPTVAEMGEWLPPVVETTAGKHYLNISRDWPGWSAYYATADNSPMEPSVEAYDVGGENSSLHNTLARLLIALAESGALDPKTLQSGVVR